MKFLSFFLFLGFLPFYGNAQLWDDFSDGNLDNNPAWTGTQSAWNINTTMQLQSSHVVPNSSFYISTSQSMASMVQWELFIKLQFNPSSANYVDVYLISGMADISHPNNTGYFVRIGNTQDEISLYRKDAGSSVKIIDGLDGIINSSENTIRLKIIRDQGNKFILWRDLTGSGNQFVSEGNIIDAQYQASAFFGILIRQSTSSFFQKHFFDDLKVSAYVPDTSPPLLNSVTATSLNNLEINFNEALEDISIFQLSNYSVNNNIGAPASVTISDPATIRLSFNQVFENGISYSVSVQNLKDLSGNIMVDTTLLFHWYTAAKYDIVIQEILADPSPPSGLPNAEFIEIKNRSDHILNLDGWRIAYNGSFSGEIPSFKLFPDSIMILTSTSHVSEFMGYGKVSGIPSFPNLSNEGGILSLHSKEGKTIHAVEYSVEWYGNELKKQGGWTLEMIDDKFPCTGQSNWKASVDLTGGTPGKENSIQGNSIDDSPPRLVRTFSLDSITLAAVFDEPLDSSIASQISLYAMNNGAVVIKSEPLSPMFNSVILTLATPMDSSQVYTLTVKDIRDCSNNIIGIFNTAKAGISSASPGNDIIINEVLFNPVSSGNDYVEIYNKGNRIVDLSQVLIATRDGSGVISSITKLKDNHYFLYPGDFAVFTEEIEHLSMQYHVKFPENCFALPLPGFSDDKGTVLLLNDQGMAIDELLYDEDWHFPLLHEKEGVSLERIDPLKSTQDNNNWQSAASSAGFGTPGYENSQFQKAEPLLATIEAQPKIMTPDLDGINDYILLHYQVEQTGYMMNSIVFDAAGRMVRLLVKNTLLGIKGQFLWDGLNEKKEKLPTGSYIIFTEIFNLEGKKQQFKNVVAIAKTF